MGQQLHIVLVEPEIPQNTGNIARTCACVGAHLHLVEPLGFRLTERNLGRAGMDYWDQVEVLRYACIEEFIEQHGIDELFLFTGQVERRYTDVSYGSKPYLLFGRESRGLDQKYIDAYQDRCVRIPMLSDMRSLNLSNAAAIAAYHVMDAWGFPDLE